MAAALFPRIREELQSDQNCYSHLFPSFFVLLFLKRLLFFMDSSLWVQPIIVRVALRKTAQNISPEAICFIEYPRRPRKMVRKR